MVRRRLIDQEYFEKITNESATNAEFELKKAADIVAKSVGTDALSLHCFNENKVLYETLDNSFIQANYRIKNGDIVLENVEEVIVNEESRKAKARQILGELFDGILEDNQANTPKLFHQLLEMKKMDRCMNKKIKKMKKCMGKDCGYMDKDSKMKKKMKYMKSGMKNMPKSKMKKMHESLLTLSENVVDYIRYMQFGPILAESIARYDEKGNVVDLKIPTLENRNNSKLLSFNWKTLNHEVKDYREMAHALSSDANFVSAINKLKRQNNLADNNALEECLEQIAKTYPTVLYLTQEELTGKISESLESANATNYDDQTCAFMAEGILRTAHNFYQDRVNRIMHLAGATQVEESQDAYEHFQNTVNEFYAGVDGRFGVERKVFTDLYSALAEVYGIADRRGDEALKQESAGYLNELVEILEQKANPDLELAEEIANWLVNYVETNLETKPWNVSNTPHITVSGDHPEMAQKAAHPYAPNRDFSGDWGDSAPALNDEGGSYKGNGADQMRHRSWGQEGGSNDVFPGLNNPYSPKGGEYTMKADTGVDKDWHKGHGSYQDGDTWPGLQNPYLPKAIHNWKMNHTPEDLVVNK